jgi:hypothetical protein
MKEENMGKKRNTSNILVGRHEGKDHLENVGTDGIIILKWI